MRLNWFKQLQANKDVFIEEASRTLNYLASLTKANCQKIPCLQGYKRIPLLNNYEEAWPLIMYVTRFLDNTSRHNGPRTRHVEVPRVRKALVAKPHNLRGLSDPARSSGTEFWNATKLSKEQRVSTVVSWISLYTSALDS